MAEKRGMPTGSARASPPAHSRTVGARSRRSPVADGDARASAEAAQVEPDAIASRRIIFIGVALVLVLLASVGGVAGVKALFTHSLGREGGAIDAPALPPVAGPPPQLSPQTDLAAYRAEKRQWLDTYGWVDRKAGVVHLPIEQAMARAAERRAGAKASP